MIKGVHKRKGMPTLLKPRWRTYLKSSKRNSGKRWKISNLDQDSSQTLPWPLTSASLLSSHMGLAISTQFNYRTKWRRITSTLILETTNPRIAKFTEEQCLVARSKSKELEQGRQGSSRSAWRDNQFHREYHCLRLSRLMHLINRWSSWLYTQKHFLRQTLKSWPLCLLSSLRSTLRPRTPSPATRTSTCKPNNNPKGPHQRSQMWSPSSSYPIQPHKPLLSKLLHLREV